MEQTTTYIPYTCRNVIANIKKAGGVDQSEALCFGSIISILVFMDFLVVIGMFMFFSARRQLSVSTMLTVCTRQVNFHNLSLFTVQYSTQHWKWTPGYRDFLSWQNLRGEHFGSLNRSSWIFTKIYKFMLILNVNLT